MKRNKIKIEENKKIQKTLRQIHDEMAYDYLIQMGEANEISQKLGLKQTFRVFNSADGTIKCDVYDGQKFKKTLTNDEFQRDLKALRKKYI